MEKMSLTVACRRFFGFKPGQTLPEFAAELKALTQKDRDEFKAMFAEIGFAEVVPLEGKTEV